MSELKADLHQSQRTRGRSKRPAGTAHKESRSEVTERQCLHR